MFGGFYEFVPVEYEDYEILTPDDGEFSDSMPSLWFPSEKTLIVTPRPRMEWIIDNEGQSSDGMMLINQLDVESDFSGTI